MPKDWRGLVHSETVPNFHQIWGYYSRNFNTDLLNERKDIELCKEAYEILSEVPRRKSHSGYNTNVQ